jgi:pyridoxine 5-phosphate synthase
MVKLGVNIDHVATVRQARRALSPAPAAAAGICEKAGCDSIVCHLREDRRHINDRDVYALRRSVKTRLNLEMSIAEDIVKIACKVKPDMATLVPEKRQELTTEGGLDVIGNKKKLKNVIKRLKDAGIEVSLFIDPDLKVIEASKDAGAEIIELHTGKYADAASKTSRGREFEVLTRSTEFARALGLTVNAGHGLDYDNVSPVAKIKGMNELNIGFSIVAYAVLYGMENAVQKMKALIS